VAYAQWFSYAFALWEEQFRGRIASYFDQQVDEKIRKSDVLVDYFGDIRLIRNDFVHNKGICKESANLKVLKWDLVGGRPIEISAEQMMSLIDLFPRDELCNAPSPQPSSEMQRVPGKVDPHLLEDVQQRAHEMGQRTINFSIQHLSIGWPSEVAVDDFDLARARRPGAVGGAGCERICERNAAQLTRSHGRWRHRLDE
jgi:hypothetical protein